MSSKKKTLKRLKLKLRKLSHPYSSDKKIVIQVGKVSEHSRSYEKNDCSYWNKSCVLVHYVGNKK